MTYNMERLKSDAKLLVSKLDQHDNFVTSLINQSKQLNNRLVAMKEYQEDVAALNELARHRPRSALIIGIAQENRQIRELQAENKELRMCVEEQQSALEMIMSKYRKQVAALILSQETESPLASAAIQAASKQAQIESGLLDRVSDMAAVMSQAAEMDESQANETVEQLERLRVENEGLRNLLRVANSFKERGVSEDLCSSLNHSSDRCSLDEMESSSDEHMVKSVIQKDIARHSVEHDESVESVECDADDSASDVTIVDSDVKEVSDENEHVED